MAVITRLQSGALPPSPVRPKQPARPTRARPVQASHSNRRPSQPAPSMDQPRMVGSPKKRRVASKGEEGTEFKPNTPPSPLASRARLFQINRELSQLELERKLLAEQLGVCKYPVLSLPNEITAEIFTHTIAASPDFGHSDSMALAQTCRHWRDVALSLPALWSAVPLRATQVSIPNLMEIWLSRSRSSPLSLSLHPELGANGFPTLSRLEKVLEAINPHLGRLERLEVGVCTRSYNFHLLQSPMPMLRRLALWCDRLSLEPPVVMAPEDVPSLRTVELYQFTRGDLLRFALPWTRITTVVCNRIDYADWRLLLEATPALIHCEVSHLQRWGLDPRTPFTLHNLKTLVFSLYTAEEDMLWSIFPLSEMRLPALRVLQIPEAYLRLPSVDDLQALVSRSECQLQELRIIDPLHFRKQNYLDRFPFVSFHRQLLSISE
ncbi:hypothetical protein C8F04DRAFT_1255655 [Mycena alexandri]|uniref:F-box domain-containing protein n=1 Tax=Mycena alexandri TaxID=1745969 RepID=A0AAD6T6M9_9AGAR|nr:hypothetical protein C8F04DRAFT_1255655 [Mycena alexandri]